MDVRCCSEAVLVLAGCVSWRGRASASERTHSSAACPPPSPRVWLAASIHIHTCAHGGLYSLTLLTERSAGTLMPTSFAAAAPAPNQPPPCCVRGFSDLSALLHQTIIQLCVCKRGARSFFPCCPWFFQGYFCQIRLKKWLLWWVSRANCACHTHTSSNNSTEAD